MTPVASVRKTLRGFARFIEACASCHLLPAVLRLAELKKRLSTDRASRTAVMQEKCRIGYVAFTRPREMLCLACLNPFEHAAEFLLHELGVKFLQKID